uniref:Calcium-transporting ATPase 3 endoplasmic reticulum-type n=1 Tax=Rhizophora mucronata TaxID=61149 RepID=A0A2P2M3J4_RHIMU
MYLMNCFVLLYIALPSATAATIEAKLSSAKTMSEALFATAVPDPIAIPISAFFKAGASFTPSPVIATTSF